MDEKLICLVCHLWESECEFQCVGLSYRKQLAAKDEKIKELENLLEQRAQSHAVSQNMVSKDQATISALTQKIEKITEDRLDTIRSFASTVIDRSATFLNKEDHAELEQDIKEIVVQIQYLAELQLND